MDLVAFGRKIHGGGRAPAFGVNHEIRAGVLVARAGDGYRLHGSVDMALAPPNVDVLPSGYLADVVAKEHVRQEEDLPALGNRLHDLDGIGRGTAVVAFGFHLGGRIDVGDDDCIRVLGLPGAKLVGVDGSGKGAPGFEVGNQHTLLRREHGGRLCHEMHATEYDDIRFRPGGLLGEAKGVADEVCCVLHIAHLVVVGQDNGVPLLLERTYLVCKVHASPP